MRIATLFRVRKADNRLFALFPTMPDDLQCVVFMGGGFSSREYFEAMNSSRPATASEAAGLLRELHDRGYRLTPIKAASVHHHLARHLEAARLRQRYKSKMKMKMVLAAG